MCSIIEYGTNRINDQCNSPIIKYMEQEYFWECHCLKLPESVEILVIFSMISFIFISNPHSDVTTVCRPTYHPICVFPLVMKHTL